ncbi:LysR family transcriptional regulator [Vibrio splendidus]|jgi:DNA-binding transcriptional LysR family regulator|tara:strand:- start:3462 stop:4382 length:921 start_codon:yes stop_codon:yes gene_type:complete
MDRGFRNLDLNLLKTLVVLYQERNTRLAAERLFTTQPSVSRALTKLREHFQQELFIRNQYGLTPTPEGDKICREVNQALQVLEQSVALHTFSPERAEGKLSISLNHFMAERYASTLYRNISRLAPNLQLEIESWNQASLSKLVQGELDFGVNFYGIDAPKELVSNSLGREAFSLYMRKGHPYLDNVRLEALSDYPLASVLISNWNQKESRVEKILRKAKVPVTVALRSENVHAIIRSLADSNLIFPAISGLLDENNQPNIVSIPIQEILDVPAVEFDRSLFYHQKNRSSEFHLWVMTQLEEVFATE